MAKHFPDWAETSMIVTNGDRRMIQMMWRMVVAMGGKGGDDDDSGGVGFMVVVRGV